MMVTFISQCEKNARKKTRRVLDAFANRIGDNTWQTVITQEGLNAVCKLLKKSASKSTAVSCHWHRSRSRSELVWIVGKREKFNQQGVVPVNSTKRVSTGTEWETGWTMATSIQILSTLAALLHDLGKATVGFQNKLSQSGCPQTDPYRHEWISLRLFEAMIAGCTTDREWLQRLANFQDFVNEQPDWQDRLHNDEILPSSGFAHLPPLARIVAWLVVTHHRLPCENRDFKNKDRLRDDLKFLSLELTRFYKKLKPYDGWVRSEKSIQERSDTEDFWRFAAQVTESRPWQKALTRWATKALNHPPLMQLPEVNNPLLMHLSRLCLMVGDHNYSSLDEHDNRRVKGDAALEQALIANTSRKTRKPKQSLDEHLLGVAQFTAAFSRLLPRLSEKLSCLEDILPFAKRTPIERFQWQNRAWNLVKKQQKEARQQGFFGVNLASTGCGKTLGNARIMAALADPERGPRFTIALGLRVLTLQTGLALREKLNLDQTKLAILVGGAAHRTLSDLQQQEKDQEGEVDHGSESAQALLSEPVDYDDCAQEKNTLGTVIHDPKARDLLFAPLVSCTIDHIIDATETARGGRHIVPMLRLLTSDLVLDEPDDFDQSDLPALSRLVHMAGMLGSNVLLSSATLTPDLVQGLFIAYREGRNHWQTNLGEKGTGIYCAWFDEFDQHIEQCRDIQSFSTQHQKFINKRVKGLCTQPIRRIGKILPTALQKAPEGHKIDNSELAQLLVNASHSLHRDHHDLCSASGKTASVGLIRIANINPMSALARALYQCPQSENVQMHLCCYHARQLLMLRSTLEQKLDRILDRNSLQSLFEHGEIRETVQASNKQHHIFIVLATAVAEVGRDHDYDWAIIEPSSMRSIIQLAGRIWRHRPDKVAKAVNVLILNNNIKALEAGNGHGVGQSVFLRPGFESSNHLLESHSCDELITKDQLANINAIPRIVKPKDPQPTLKLADLEHQVMADLFHPPSVNAVTAFWQPNTAMQANIHLQRVTPFRDSSDRDVEFVAVPNSDKNAGIRFRYREKAWDNPYGGDSMNSKLRYTPFVPDGATVAPWLVTDFDEALDDLSERLGDGNQLTVAMRFATVSLDHEKEWCFHPWFGFWPKP